MTSFSGKQVLFCVALAAGVAQCSAWARPVAPPLAGADAGQWHYLKLGNGFAYDVLLPFGYSARFTYPIILYLHGVGAQAPAGTPPHNAFPMFMNSISVNGVNYRAIYPAIIVAPQCASSSIHTNDWGGTDVRLQNGRLSNPDMPCGDGAIAALREVVSTTSANRARISIVGYSMGGIGAYYLFATHPHLFAAAMPIAGAILGDVSGVDFDRLIESKPLWAFHGFDDRIVPNAWDETLYDSSTRRHGRMKYTEFIKPKEVTKYPSKVEPQHGDGHADADTAAFEIPATLDWLFARSN